MFGIKHTTIFLNTIKMYRLTKSITPATITCNPVPYNGSNQIAQNLVVTIDGDTLVENTDYTIITNAGGINVGTYPIVIQGMEDYVDTASGSFTIIQAQGNANISGASVAYTGSAQNLINVSNNTGTMYYKVGTDGTWSTTIPTATTVGSWTIYYYMEESINYTGRGNIDVPWGSVTATINKADQAAPTATGSTVAYGQTATATCSGGGGHGSIEWSNGTTQSSVGSKTTKVRWTGDSNYNASPWSNEVTLTVSKASQSAPTAYGATTTYNTTATASYIVGGGQGSIEWSNGNTQTSVGSKTTQARWSGNANYDPSPWSNVVTLTMNKADQSAPTAYGSSVAYGNTATASASGGGGQGSIEWSNGNSRSAMGSQTTYARWSGNGNYNPSPWSNAATLTVSKANQSAPTAYGASVSEGSTATASASGGGGHGSIEWSNGNTRTAVGSQTTRARWSGDYYYNASDWSNEVTLTVTANPISKTNVNISLSCSLNSSYTQLTVTANADRSVDTTVTIGVTVSATINTTGGTSSSSSQTLSVVIGSGSSSGSNTLNADTFWEGVSYSSVSCSISSISPSSSNSQNYISGSGCSCTGTSASSYYVVVAVTNNTGKTSPAVSALASDGTYLVQLCSRQNGNFTTTPTVSSSGTVRKINVNENGGYIGYITISFRGNTIMAKQYIGMQSNITNISLTRTFELEDAKNGSNTIYITFEDS